MKEENYYRGCISDIKINPKLIDREKLQKFLKNEYSGLRITLIDDFEVENFLILRAHVPVSHDLIEGEIDPVTNKKVATKPEPLSREMWFKLTDLVKAGHLSI